MTKGANTRERILDRAFRMAAQIGLEGLSIGALAGELGLSKSGLFAHFGSKEELQLALLQAAAERFEAQVLRPAFRAPRGLPRLRKLFENWLAWGNDPTMPGGCIFVAAAADLDDREGRARDVLVSSQKQLRATLAKSLRLAIAEGHLRSDVDCEQLAFEIYALVLGYHHSKRLLRLPDTEVRVRTAFDRLIASAEPLYRS